MRAEEEDGEQAAAAAAVGGVVVRATRVAFVRPPTLRHSSRLSTRTVYPAAVSTLR